MITGPFRESRNAANTTDGGMHHDDTARANGFRGGAVAGSIHLDLFPPRLIEAFGPAWYDRGSLSIGYVNHTIDREPVRASLGDDDDGTGQVRAWVERSDGLLVAEGTASVGTPAAGVVSALRARDLSTFSTTSPVLLAGVAAGDALGPTVVHVDGGRQQRLLEDALCTEPLDWYSGSSPWGGPIALPQHVVHSLFRVGEDHCNAAVAANGGALGMFGAIEIENLDGPLLLDRDYTVAGRIVAVGDSPKTEYAWFELTASDDGDRAVTRLFMQLRFVKSSSPAFA